MNKVFKVVWNEVRASYMVCDENSMTRGKPKSVKTAVLAASVAAMMGFGSIAAAADPVIVEGQTYENVSVTESSNHPLKAQVSATADDASSLTVKDSTFRNNSMTLEDTSGGPAAVGVAATGVDVSVSGSTFDKNTVSVAQDGKDTNGIYGAAIGVGDGNLTVTGSDFTGNQAVSKRQTQGAAIYQSVGNITVSDSNFIGNTGSSDGGNVTGGAVSLWGVSGTIDNAHFEGNVASVENDGGNAVYGGAIYTRSGVWGGENDTQLTVSNSTFTGNSAEGSTDAKGGAIYAKGDPDYNDGYEHALNVENSKFEGNHADTQGGAIYALDVTTTVSGDSSFVGNTAQNGGAIYNDKGDLNVGEGAVFKDNVSTAQNYGGGAIHNDGGNVTIGNGVQFVGNKLDQPVSDSTDRDMRSAGGAIASWNGGSLNIGENVVFENNGYNTSGDVAWSGGGAIYLDTDTENVAEMTIGSGTRFSGNVAGSLGGAIYAGDSRTEITGTTFENNKAGSWGGAIFAGQYYALDGHGVTISGSQFNGNEAGNYGGAIASQYTALNVADTTFSGNKAGLQGGAIFVQGDASDTDYAGSATIENSAFSGNAAGQIGGAIYVQNAALSISGTTFDGNTVAVDGKGNSGGALYINNSGETVATVKDSTFTNNTAGYTADVNSPSDIVWSDGGAIAYAGGVLNIDNTQFVSNSAAQGGAISQQHTNDPGHTATDTLNITNSAFTGNMANAGGAISAMRTVTISDSSFTGNTAVGDTDGGGAMFIGAESDTVIERTTFDGNKSLTSSGGAIDARKGDLGNNKDAKLEISNSIFKNNEALGVDVASLTEAQQQEYTGKGGAIRNAFYGSKTDPVRVTITGTQFENNKAIYGGAIYNEYSGKVAETTTDAARIAITDATFTGNSATAEGGAIYNTTGSEIVFNGTNTFSGNTANGVANDIYNDGTITVASGETVLDGGITGKGTVDIDGGKLVAATIHTNANTINLNSGTLQTGSDQVMQVALDADGTVTDAAGLKEGAGVTYTGGELALTDAKYNLDYAKSVANAINNNNATAVTMLGELVGQTGPVSVGDLDGAGLGMATVDVVADNGAGLVVGSDTVPTGEVNGNDYSDAETHNNSLGAQTLVLENGGNAVLVTGDKSLTLTGDGSDLVKTDTGTANIDVGHDTIGGGVLNLGSDVVANGGTLAGTVTVGETGTVNVNGAEYAIDGTVSVNDGVVNVNDGATLNVSEVALDGEANVNVTGTMKVDTLTGSADSVIIVGNDQAAGNVSIGSLSLNGGMMILDPDWVDGVGIEGASQSATASWTNGAIDGKLAGIRNSMYVLGTDTTDWAQQAFASSGRVWGPNDITAALAIAAPQKLDAALGAIYIDGSQTPDTISSVSMQPNTATFADNSMLIVDATGIGTGDQAAISGDGSSTATVADKAALHVVNAKNGQEVGILNDFQTVTVDGDGWQGTNLTSGDAMISLTVKENGSNGNYTVAATANNAADVFAGVVPVNGMNRIWQNGVNDVNSANGGIAFLSRAADSRYVNHADAVRQINGAAQIAVAAGVQAASIQAMDAVNDTLQEHLSLTSNVSQKGAPSLHKEGADLWVSMLYRDGDSGGLKAGGFSSDYENNFGGIMVGTDYTWKGAVDGYFRIGGALNIGKGDSNSNGNFNYTDNDYDTYGLSLYGGWNNDNINVVADVGYMKGDHDLKQHMSQALGGNLKADVDTEIWTAGIRGEYQFKTTALDVTPHIGIRYMHLETDSFSTHNGLGTVFHTDSDSQNLWQFPIGVTLSRDYVSTSGWTVKPKFDLSVIPAAGDKDVSTTVGVPGMGVTDSATADMMDSVSWQGTLGLEVQKEATSFGLQAGYRKSDDAKSRGVMVTFGHQFE